ncbi:MAG: DnrP protein [Pseudomonadaceae bacterium]|nr:DnrP protein [Pseudomonadaceae bacterium]
MPQCLYCQRENPPAQVECAHCGMPLPTQTDTLNQRSQQRFMWFCIGLTVFCAVMSVWLPRSLV